MALTIIGASGAVLNPTTSRSLPNPGSGGLTIIGTSGKTLYPTATTGTINSPAGTFTPPPPTTSPLSF